ncbi:MAG: TFIIB-type zinc ribbon-containing protein [Planctomycetota bacterium]
MGEAEPFVRFNCENCGYKSAVSESYAGKNIRCPNCYYIIFISKTDSTGTTQTSSGYSDYDSSLLNIQEQNILKHRQMCEDIASEQTAESEEEEEPPQETDPAALRKLPWVIDIFLYPFNWPGLKHLAIFILVPPLFNILARFLPSIFVYLVMIAGFIVNFLIFLYMYWYLVECVHESASGWVRAPLGFGGLPTLRDMFGQVVNIIGCLAVFFAPFVLYMLIAQKTGIIFWLLLISAVFLYPMALLSVLMHDSSHGLNFHKFTRSISNTFFPYCGLVLFLILTVVLISLIPSETTESPLGNCIFRFVIIYAAFIGAHLLGRFYWRYQDKLNWDLEGDKK